MELQIQKIKETFKDLRFEEEPHLYYVGDKKLKLSVSGVIKKLVNEADFESIAKHKDVVNDLPQGTTAKLWNLKKEAACAIGNRAHFFGEVYAFNKSISPDSGYEKAIVKFWKSLPDHIIPVFTELEMYHLNLMFGGTADIILYNTKTKKFIIGDYKTNEDIFKNFMGKTLLAPFDSLLDMPYSKYEVQFSLYQILLEQAGVEVENRVLVWVKPDSTFKAYFTKDYTAPLKEYLKTVVI